MKIDDSQSVDNINFDSTGKPKRTIGPGTPSYEKDTIGSAAGTDKDLEKFLKPNALSPEAIQQKKRAKVQECMEKIDDVLNAMREADKANGTPGDSEQAICKMYQLMLQVVEEQEELASMLRETVIESNDEKREAVKEKVQKENQLLEQGRTAKTLNLISSISGIVGSLGVAAAAGTAATATLAIAGASVLLVADQMADDYVKKSLARFLSWGSQERENTLATVIGFLANGGLSIANMALQGTGGVWKKAGEAIMGGDINGAVRWVQSSTSAFRAAAELVKGVKEQENKKLEVDLMDLSEKVEGKGGAIKSASKNIEGAIKNSHEAYKAAANINDDTQETLSAINSRN
jgi:hypothetical protein